MLLSERACKHPAASSQSSVTINQKKKGGEKNEAELEKGKEGMTGGRKGEEAVSREGIKTH